MRRSTRNKVRKAAPIALKPLAALALSFPVANQTPGHQQGKSQQDSQGLATREAFQ